MRGVFLLDTGHVSFLLQSKPIKSEVEKKLNRICKFEVDEAMN
jgi:hypothetical protein